MAPLRRQGDRALHRLQVAAQPAIPLRGKAFQVDVGGVDQREQSPPGGLLNGAVGHQHIDQAPLMDQSGAVPDVLITDQRLIVGVGHPDISIGPQLQRFAGQRLRGYLRRFQFPVSGHGYFMILAEGTVQVAPKAAHRQNHTAGVEPPQRLFLNGIQCQTGQFSIVQRDDRPIPTGSGPAEACLSFGQIAVVKT